MYNRYIPQSDGTYQRNRVQEAQKNKPQVPPPPPVPMPHIDMEECPASKNQPAKVAPQPVGILNFFRQLLPKNLDTADLLIILLLLLMAGDNEEEKSNALLTMALYFLM